MTSKPQFVGERVSFSQVFAEVSRGVKKFKQNQYAEHGLHPIIDQGKEVVAGYSDEESGLFTDVPAIVFGDHTRCVKYVEEPFFAGADGVKILKPKLSGNCGAAALREGRSVCSPFHAVAWGGGGSSPKL